MESKLVHVECREKFAFIKLNSNELTKDIFLKKGMKQQKSFRLLSFTINFILITFDISALELFGVKQHINFHVDLIDNIRTPVDDSLFKDVIETFHKNDGFYLELKYGVDFDKGPKIVTPYVCQYFHSFQLLH